MESATTQPRKGKYWSRQPRPAEERFWEKVDAFGDCWEWQASDNGKGYGRFYPTHTTTTYAHIYIWELLVGPIPEGMTIDHQCRNRRCVNPDHLRLLTRGANTLDGYSPWALNARKTHCPQGHAYDDRNTYFAPSGSRLCRQCHRTRHQEASARRRAA